MNREQIESKFPLKIYITEEIIQNADVMDNRKCNGALALKSVFPENYASWGCYSGGVIDDRGDRIDINSGGVEMMGITTPRFVTFYLNK